MASSFWGMLCHIGYIPRLWKGGLQCMHGVTPDCLPILLVILEDVDQGFPYRNVPDSFRNIFLLHPKRGIGRCTWIMWRWSCGFENIGSEDTFPKAGQAHFVLSECCSPEREDVLPEITPYYMYVCIYIYVIITHIMYSPEEKEREFTKRCLS